MKENNCLDCCCCHYSYFGFFQCFLKLKNIWKKKDWHWQIRMFCFSKCSYIVHYSHCQKPVFPNLFSNIYHFCSSVFPSIGKALIQRHQPVKLPCDLRSGAIPGTQSRLGLHCAKCRSRCSKLPQCSGVSAGSALGDKLVHLGSSLATQSLRGSLSLL